MQIVERFVLAKLRNRTFFSLAALNAAIRDCVAEINAKIMRHIGKSRAELLETLDRPALKALPNAPYPMKGVGPFLHIDPDDRPPVIFATQNALHFAEDQRPYLLLPVIPER